MPEQIIEIDEDGKVTSIGPCECVIKNREEGEDMREWLKRCMCMFHWMQTDYYQSKVK